MSITLFDIFYQHRNWWNDPSLGKDTQGKYGEVINEMEACACEYAKDIKAIGDKWKWVIENETRDLCRPNHYSFFLKGEKKEWHDLVMSDFLLHIKKAMQHYGYNFKELPRNIQALFGIEYFGQQPQQKNAKWVSLLPDGNSQNKKAIRIFKKAINANLITIAESGLHFNGSNALLSYLCGIIYCGDTTIKDSVTGDILVKRGSSFFPDVELCKLFNVKNLGQSRQQLFRQPKGHEIVDNLF